MTALRKDFEEFLAKRSPHQRIPTQVNVLKMQQLLLAHLKTQFKAHPILAHQFTQEAVADTSKLILSAVYSSQMEYFRAHHIVATVSLLQHFVHSDLGLPPTVAAKTQRLLRFHLNHTPFEAIHPVYEEMMASTANQQFLQQTFPTAFSSRTLSLLKSLGFYPKSMAMPVTLFKTLIEQQKETGKVCGEWVALCIAYLLLWLKFEQFKQKPLLLKLISKAEGGLNAEEVMLFYNKVFLGTVSRLDKGQWQKWLEQVQVDHYIGSEFVVTPILSDNNTVLDNAFSSSWDPSQP